MSVIDKNPGTFLAKLSAYAGMIKLSHTIFALPFALSAVVLAARHRSPTLSDLFWILLAMVGARSAAMGFNRIADAAIDSANPRTKNREIPAGTLARGAVILFVAASSLLFILAAGMLGRLPLLLSVPVLAALFFYSYTKRFTWLCHLYLGLCISLAPLGAWIAMTGSFHWAVCLLSLALATYIAGFDILYACQDSEFDREAGLYSIPATLGVDNALRFSSALHVISFALFAAIHPAFGLGPVYLVTVVLIGILLVVEHRLVNASDLSRINIAFFHVNSVISILLFLGIFADEMLRGVL